MTGLSRRFAIGNRLISSAFAVLFVTWCAWQGGTQAATLTSQNSTINLDLTTPGGVAGMTSWTVDGVNQMGQQWFWYRVGPSGPESDLTALGAPSVVPFGSAQLTATYGSSPLSIRLSYVLTGNPVGTGKSGVNEGATIFNNSGSTMDFHFFEYTHLTLLGAGGGTVTIGNANDTLHQVSGAVTFNQVLTPAASRSEVAANGVTRGELTDGNPTTLNNTTTGSGDVTWAFEWDLSIAAGSSAAISLPGTIVTVVPEPGAAALLIMGAVVCFFRRQPR